MKRWGLVLWVCIALWAAVLTAPNVAHAQWQGGGGGGGGGGGTIPGNALPTHNFANSIASTGIISGAQPSAADIAAGTFAGGFTFSTAPIMSGANISSATIPDASLVTAPVTSVTANAPITSSGGATPAIGLSTPLSVANGGRQCGAPSTFAGLPSSPTNGETCGVTDATACTAGTSVTVGGGAVKCQVTYNGTNWMPGGGVTSAAAGGVTSVTGTAPIVSSGGTTPAVSLSGVTSEQGNGPKVQLSTGTATSGDCVKFDVNGNTVDNGAACGAGGGGSGGGIGGTTTNSPGPDGVYNVINYGAVGNGVTDDGPAIRSTIAAMPGSLGSNTQGATLYFPPNKTYFINTNSNSQAIFSGAYDCAIELNRPMTVIAYGARFVFGTGIGGHPALCPNGNIAGEPGIGSGVSTGNFAPTIINLPVADGSISVTTTTAADASRFNVGDWVWLTGGETTSNSDQFAEQVQAVNASTGVITFTRPTPKPLLSGAGCSPPQNCNNNGPGIYPATFGLVFNIFWYGGSFEDTSPSSFTPSATLDTAQTENVVFKDMRFLNGGGNQTGMMEDTVFDNVYYDTSCTRGAAWDVEFNSSRVTYKNGTAICDPGGTTNSLVTIGEGSDHITLDNNEMVNNSCPSIATGTVNFGGGTQNEVIRNNKIYQMNPGNCGPALSLSCEDTLWTMKSCTTTVTGNYIYSAGNTGLSDGRGTSEIVANNTIIAADTAASGSGAAMNIGNEPNQVTGNYLYGEAGLIFSYGAGNINTGSTINTNVIQGFGTGAADFGIYIGDPGTTAPNPDLTILGNTIIAARGTGFCLSYSNSGHNPNVITGAAVPGVGLNQCATSISP